MAQYRIVCTEQEPVHQPTTHAHIVAVGTGTDPDKADQRWTLAEVIAAMNAGDEFWTYGEQSKKWARVHQVRCQHCVSTIIRSGADAVPDNNLDNLRRCQWR
jgi:hypothetical protein